MNSSQALSTVSSIPPRYNTADNENADDDFRDIHALTPSPLPPPPGRQRVFDAGDRRSSNLSVASDVTTNSSENFTTMSREFNALVLAGSTIDRSYYDHIGGNGNENNGNGNDRNNNFTNSNNLGRIGEDEGEVEETNPLAIVPDVNPLPSPRVRNENENRNSFSNYTSGSNYNNSNSGGEIAIHRVKKEEVETKIMAWQTAKVAKISNRFKREDAIISGWENEQVQKATSWMKKVERKLEEKRAKAMEKMQNDIAKAHRKAEERRASAEGKRGIKVAKVLEVANLMRAVGRPPAKRSLF